ncbi:MAG: ABC transporter permease [Dehalococcoidia bacterium]
MLTYAARRIPQVIPTLILASIVTFTLLRLVPGDIADVLAVEGAVSEETKVRIREELGFDQPAPVQYVQWLGNLVTGDLGHSYWTNRPVHELFRHAFPKTVELAALSMAIAVLIGIPLGLLAGAFKGSVFDYAGTLLATLMTSVPTFAIGILALLLFAVQLRWLPATGSVILPALVLGVDISGSIVRTLKSDVRAELQSDYIRTAHAKGVPPRRVLTGHLLRNSMTATVTVLGLVLGNLLGGTVIVETVFNWPGIGSLTIGAIRNRDYPVVQAMVMAMTLAFVFATLLVDLLYGLLDPRVRTE